MKICLSFPFRLMLPFHIKTGKHHYFDESRVFYNEEEKYHLLKVYLLS